MSRFHSCVDPQCSCAETRIATAEIERDYPEDPGPDHAGERMYEAYLDRMGGSA